MFFTKELILLAGIFGALWGSFANVVIARWPLGLSVVRPGSHCFACKAPIAWYDNIPVFSYLILLGKCRKCHTRFSPRYMIVELCMAIVSMGLMKSILVYDHSLFDSLILYFTWFFFMWSMITISVIDFENYLIPDVIVIPAAIFGVSIHVFFLTGSWIEPTMAAVLGYLGMRLLFIDGYFLLTGKYGMGLGDAKLIAMIGAFLGFEGILFALFAGSIQGLIMGLIMVLLRRKKGMENEPVFEEELDCQGELLNEPDYRLQKARVPFGPFLALGAIEYYFIGQYILTGYQSLIGNLIYGG
jgi:leader peptidase (prepilin peptidase) / N-methyltransferase